MSFPLPPEESVVSNVLAGMTSGAVASAIANPTDVLKVLGVPYTWHLVLFTDNVVLFNALCCACSGVSSAL